VRWPLMRSVVITIVVLGLGCGGKAVDGPHGGASACITDEVTAPLRGGEPGTDDDCKTAGAACKVRCDGGDGDACVAYALGRQTDDAPAGEVTGLFERGCRLGAALGCTKVGVRLWDQREQSQAAGGCASRLFDRTCAAKEPYGCAAAGMVMIEQAHGAGDLARARQLLQHSCDELDGAPCYMLAIYLQQGKFGAVDEATLGQLLSKACIGNIADACDPYGLRGSFHDR
jgi:hypothetical protein